MRGKSIPSLTPTEHGQLCCLRLLAMDGCRIIGDQNFFQASSFPPFFFLSLFFFSLVLVAGWKLSPMVGAMYGPELYAGEVLGMCSLIRYYMPSYCCVLLIMSILGAVVIFTQFPFIPMYYIIQKAWICIQELLL